jgi:hypothetical protein
MKLNKTFDGIVLLIYTVTLLKRKIFNTGAIAAFQRTVAPLICVSYKSEETLLR